MNAYFSVLVPVYRTVGDYLREMIESVRAQTFDDWQLVLVDDGSDDPDLTAGLQAAAASDERIVVEVLERNSGIVAATNRALELADGSFVCLLDHDDVLAPDALSRVRKAIDEQPDADVLYSDELIIGPAGEVLGEFGKPEFSPERLRGQMYTGHLGSYRRSLLDRIGGLRDGFDGSQDYDLVLRSTELARQVVHIPEALYRWRTLPSSVSHSAGNQYVFDAARRALAEHLRRRGSVAEVVQTDSTGRYRIDRALPDDATVAVLIPANGARSYSGRALREGVLEAVQGIEARIGLLSPQLVIVAGDGVDRWVLDAVSESVAADRLTIIRAGGPVTSTDINRAVIDLEVSHLVLLAEHCVPVSIGWIDRLVALAADPEIGVVTPRLVDEQGRIRASGLAFAGGSPRAIGAGAQREDAGPFGALQVNREVTAPPADAVSVGVSLFREVGGLSPLLELPGAVADLALKAAEMGRRAVATTEVEVTTDRDPRLPGRLDLELLHARWGRYLDRDRYWPH